MHCVTLAELAAFFAQYAPSLRQRTCVSDGEALMRYWTANRVRQERWHRAMGVYRDASQASDFQTLRTWWSESGVILEEILVGELLARVVAAIGAASIDSKPPPGAEIDNNFYAVGRGVFQAQLEASNRAIKIILESTGSTPADRVRLNRLRHGTERWTDWLVGRVGGDTTALSEYCIDLNRATQFRNEVREGIFDRDQDITTWLMNASMREMLMRRTSPQTALPDENRRVAESAIGLFRPELFDDYGVPKSLWLQRLQTDSVNQQAHLESESTPR